MIVIELMRMTQQVHFHADVSLHQKFMNFCTFTLSKMLSLRQDARLKRASEVVQKKETTMDCPSFLLLTLLLIPFHDGGSKPLIAEWMTGQEVGHEAAL